VISAVVFDLDGVLLDSEPVWEEVRREFVVDRGGTWSEEIQRNLMGMSTAEWARYLSEQIPGTPTAVDVASAVIARMRSEYERDLPLVDGARDVVQGLSTHWPLGLASSSPLDLIDVVLSFAELEKHFDAVVSADSVARGKPAPDVYNAVFERLRTAAHECVAVEDSSNGIRAAVAAGAHVVAVPNRAFPPDPDVLVDAALVLDDIHELTAQVVAGLAD
jgi:HAD superfamily hydrolase (TIGR01509 family)